MAFPIGLRGLRELALLASHKPLAHDSAVRRLHSGMLLGPLASPLALLFSHKVGSLLPSAPEQNLESNYDGNCYGYATGARSKWSPGHYALRDGLPAATLFFAAEPDTTSVRALRRALRLDGSLKLRPWHALRPHHGATLAAAFLSPAQDWHFVRLNSDGSWSHQPGLEDPRLDGLPGHLLMGPVRVAGHHRYIFVGLYLVPLRGAPGATTGSSHPSEHEETQPTSAPVATCSRLD